MPPLVQPLAIAALSVAWLVAAPVAQAQRQPQGQTQQRPASSNISDQKLDAAAAAIEQVASLREKYEQRMSSASPTEKQRLAGEANSAMKKAVTDHGLSVDEYTSILEVAQNDPSVRDRLLQRIHPNK